MIGVNSRKNSWLMSYGQGIQLPYIHWEQISHPKFIIPIFKSDASGEMAGNTTKKEKNTPILYSDFNVIEPIKSLVGTSAMFRTLLDNSPSKVGDYTGDKASNYLKNLGNTEFSWKQIRPLPTETGFFNKKEGRYIYTEKGGWVDMAHFMFYAGKAYQYKLEGKENPVGEAVQDGYKQEISDKYAAKHSAYSYEDLPSDKFGAEFGAKYFDPKSKETFGEQLESYLNKVLKATDPKKAPNYERLPTTEPEKPTRTNETTIPVYTKESK